MNKEDQQAYDIVKKLFQNDDGKPFEMTPGQISLFRAIYEKQEPRIQFDCYTQYGKSDVVSMAVLLRVATFQEKWIILGATKDKASIIMGKLIKHIFENDYTMSKFQMEEGESADQIRRSKAKDNITFKVDETGIGQVITLSADARKKSSDAGDILIGHGAQNLIEDDAALIPDKIHGKALRMLGGHSANNSFLLKITNSFGDNHAKKSRFDPKYKVIVIDYKQGLAEGRLTEEFVTEMKQALDPVMFGILYDCVYPPSDMVEDGGWMSLLIPEQVEEAQRRNLQSIGKKRLGVDVAEGTNMNAFVIRTDNLATVKETTHEKDLMKTAERVVGMSSEERVADTHIWIDATSIGSGVYSRLKQLGINVNSFKGGESPTKKTEAQKVSDPIEYANLRAECYWKARNWVLQGGGLDDHKDWQQLSKIKYRVASDKRIQIMPKEEMRARGDLLASESTDIPDAWSMTFAPAGFIIGNVSASAPIKPYYPEIDGGGMPATPQQSGGLPTFRQSEAKFEDDFS